MFLHTAHRIDEPPADFDQFIEWWSEASDRLVLLDPFTLPQVRAATGAALERVREHVSSASTLALEPSPGERLRELNDIVRSDHRWFETSLEELAGLLHVVELDDHGGHRQALGQYGRLLAAALARHRREESEFERLRAELFRRPLRNSN